MQDDNKVRNDKANLGDSINEFIQRNRKTIFIIAGIIVILFLGTLAFITVKSNIDKKASAAIEELIKKSDEQKPNFNDENFADDTNALIAELETFAAKQSGFSGSKAWSLLAEIYTVKKDWAKAEEAYIKAARAGKNTYLGPTSLFNAAAAAEEQGRLDEAINLLNQSVSHKIEFPAAPRAQFAIGRLYEKSENFSGAIEAYREILVKWPEITEWQNLARNRIIAIEIK